MSSLQNLPSSSKIAQVPDGPVGESFYSASSKHPIGPNLAILLSNIDAITQLAHIVQEQVLQVDVAASSSIDKYERAYVTEDRKLYEMGREIDFLQQEIVKGEARYQEMNRLNTHVEQACDKLEEENIKLAETIELRDEEIRNLKLELYETADESCSAEEDYDDEKPVQTPGPITVEDEKDSTDNTPSNYAASPVEPKGTRRSLKRKHSEVERDSEDEDQPSSTRQRK